MRYEDENIWLMRKMMAVLYDVGVNIVQDRLFQSNFDKFLENVQMISGGEE